jgi:type I restriction enzyme, S subunit
LRLVSTAGNSAGVLDTKLVKSFEIFRPSLPEQRAIAEALSDVDGLLGALEALIAKKRAIKQAAMQQLLTGKTRLPGFTGEWKVNQLGEIADVDPENLPSGTNPGYRFAYYYSCR